MCDLRKLSGRKSREGRSLSKGDSRKGLAFWFFVTKVLSSCFSHVLSMQCSTYLSRPHLFPCLSYLHLKQGSI